MCFIRLATIFSLTLLAACNETIEVKYGNVDSPNLITSENALDVSIEEFTEEYLGNVVTLSNPRFVSCTYQAGIANACIIALELTPIQIGNDITQISAYVYLNYTYELHEWYYSSFENRSLPKPKDLQGSIFVSENTTQEACYNEENKYGRTPPHPKTPWKDCEFSQPDFSLTGRIFNITEDNMGVTRKIREISLDIIPTGLSYSYEKSILQ
jgi:hypothetical protein